jgi:hypothetical protein
MRSNIQPGQTWVRWRRAIHLCVAAAPPGLRVVVVHHHPPEFSGYKELKVLALLVTTYDTYSRAESHAISDYGQPEAPPSPESLKSEGWGFNNQSLWCEPLVLWENGIQPARDIYRYHADGGLTNVVVVAPGEDAAAAGEAALEEMRRLGTPPDDDDEDDEDEDEDEEAWYEYGIYEDGEDGEDSDMFNEDGD